MKKSIFSICLLLFTALPLSAEVSLYMIPKIVFGSAEVRVGDIARIEGSSSIVRKVENIVVEKRYYQDGYIDRSELLSSIKGELNTSVYIYGSASRVLKEGVGEKPSIGSFSGVHTGEPAVKNGDSVRVLIRKNGITVEIAGTASGSGSTGDMIQVHFKNRRRIMGKITGRRLVEVNL